MSMAEAELVLPRNWNGEIPLGVWLSAPSITNTVLHHPNVFLIFQEKISWQADC